MPENEQKISPLNQYSLKMVRELKFSAWAEFSI
jgi:hypothetical protein